MMSRPQFWEANDLHPIERLSSYCSRVPPGLWRWLLLERTLPGVPFPVAQVWPLPPSYNYKPTHNVSPQLSTLVILRILIVRSLVFTSYPCTLEPSYNTGLRCEIFNTVSRFGSSYSMSERGHLSILALGHIERRPPRRQRPTHCRWEISSC